MPIQRPAVDNVASRIVIERSSLVHSYVLLAGIITVIRTATVDALAAHCDPLTS